MSPPTCLTTPGVSRAPVQGVGGPRGGWACRGAVWADEAAWTSAPGRGLLVGVLVMQKTGCSPGGRGAARGEGVSWPCFLCAAEGAQKQLRDRTQGASIPTSKDSAQGRARCQAADSGSHFGEAERVGPKIISDLGFYSAPALGLWAGVEWWVLASHSHQAAALSPPCPAPRWAAPGCASRMAPCILPNGGGTPTMPTCCLPAPPRKTKRGRVPAGLVGAHRGTCGVGSGGQGLAGDRSRGRSTGP